MKRIIIFLIFWIIQVNCFSQVIDGLYSYDDEFKIIVNYLKENRNLIADIKSNDFYNHFELQLLNDSLCKYSFIKPFNKEELIVSLSTSTINPKQIKDKLGFIINNFKFYNGKDSINRCIKTKFDSQSRPIEIHWIDTIKFKDGITTSDTTITKKIHFFNRKKRLRKVLIWKFENNSKTDTKYKMYIRYKRVRNYKHNDSNF